jgi:DNA primase
MRRFSPAFIDEVVSRSDLVEIIGRHVDLKKSGSNLMGLCPFHHEKSPSFSVSPDKQLYYCFGCGKGGGVIQFLTEHDGYSFPEAIEYLAEKAGMALPADTEQRPEEEEKRRQGLDLLARAAAGFARQLASPAGQAARDYLARRGMPEQVIRDYQVGYAPPGYGFVQKALGGERQAMALAETAGLVFRNDSGGYGDRFRDRVMFPIRDRRGHIVGFGGRVLGDGEPKYLNSPETPFFHKSELLYGLSEHRDEIRRRKQLVVVEGYMDVLAMAAHGLKVGVAPLGTAIGERQLREILRLHEAPVFCFDGDRAGRQAAWRALEQMLPALKAELAPRFLYLPEGEDPDSLLAREGAEAFARRLADEGRPVLETWLTGLRLLAGQGAEGRARMAKKADQMLAAMADDYLKQAWRQEAEKATGLRLAAGAARARRPAPERPVRAPAMTLADQFMAALLQQPERLSKLTEADSGYILLDGEAAHRVYTRAFDLGKKQPLSGNALLKILMQEYPDEPNLPRWANQPALDEAAFDALLVAVKAESIRRRLQAHRHEMGLEEAMRLQRELQALNQQRRG